MLHRLTTTVLAAALAAPLAAMDLKELTDEERALFRAEVRAYLMENPEVIEDALIALSQKRQLEELELARAAIAENQDRLLNYAGDYSIGPADAAVTVVEFFDYRCGYCKRSASWAAELPDSAF